MTKRLAIYVEGQTEQVFIERLISEIAGAHNVRFSKTSYAESRIIKLDQIAGSAEEEFFVLLYDCQGESNVKSKVLEDHGKLAKNGYQLIIGLRDLHPKPLADLSGVTETTPPNRHWIYQPKPPKDLVEGFSMWMVCRYPIGINPIFNPNAMKVVE